MGIERLSYRCEIDGLRAIAIGVVVLCHAGFPYLDGGFIGVDVFFVISGYLITGLIAADCEKGKFSIFEFYERRIRRILPALYVVLLFTVIMSITLLVPDMIRASGESLLSIMTFVSNIYFWQQSGYFGDDAKLSPLLHTWSLSVEEQFYLLFPLLLSGFWFIGRFRLTLFFGVISFLSIVLAQWLTTVEATAGFFLLPGRVWELLIGAIVALLPRKSILDLTGSLLAQAFCLASLAGLAVSILLFNPATPHPSVFTIVPVVCTATILLFCNGHGLSGWILSNRLMVGIGLISYSLYLWHQPIFVFARLMKGGEPNLTTFAALSIAALIISYLSWRFVEQPFRSRQVVNRKQLFATAVVSTITAGIVGLMATIFSTVPLRMTDIEGFARYEVIAAADPKIRPMEQSGCHIWSATFTTAFREQFDLCGSQFGKAIFVTGDSHGMDLYNTIASSADYPFIVSVSRGYCRPHDINFEHPPHRCHYEDLEDFLVQHGDAIKILFYTQTPDRLFNAKNFARARTEDLSIEAIDEVIEYLSRVRARSGVEVVFMGLLPPLLVGPADFSYHQPLDEQVRNSYSDRNVNLTKHAERVFAERLNKSGLLYVSKMNAFDLQLPDEILVDGQFTFSDARHLTTFGQQYFGKALVAKLIELGLLPKATEIK